MNTTSTTSFIFGKFYNLNMKYRLKETIYYRERDGVIQLLDYQKNDNVYFELDAYAARTLILLMKQIDRNKIVEIIKEESGQDEDSVRPEIFGLIDLLLKHDLVEEA